MKWNRRAEIKIHQLYARQKVICLQYTACPVIFTTTYFSFFVTTLKLQKIKYQIRIMYLLL